MKSVFIDESKTPKGQVEPLDESIEEPKDELLDVKIIRALRNDSKATYDNLVSDIGVSQSTIKRAVAKLVAAGRIERMGGKRYGYWKIND